ncbi:hypothetical protein ABZP36_010843 [Zizania latifolia]
MTCIRSDRTLQLHPSGVGATSAVGGWDWALGNLRLLRFGSQPLVGGAPGQIVVHLVSVSLPLLDATEIGLDFTCRRRLKPAILGLNSEEDGLCALDNAAAAAVTVCALQTLH